MLRLYSIISIVINPAVTFGGTLILAILFSFSSWYERFFWLTLLFCICFMIPAIWYGELLVHGRIDTDVKNRKSRAGLFHVTTIAFASSFAILVLMNGARLVGSVLLSAVIVNLIYSIAITFFKSEFSVHLGGLTLLVVFMSFQLSSWFAFAGLPFILLLAWSRYALRMHTFIELAGGFLASVIVYVAIAIFM